MVKEVRLKFIGTACFPVSYTHLDVYKRQEWGVPNAMGIIPGRVTYVIDKDGVVRLVFNSLKDAEKHVSEAVTEVHKLAGK